MELIKIIMHDFFLIENTITMNYLYNLKNKIDDLIIKEIKLKNNSLYVINIETITSSMDINAFILNKMILLENLDDNNLINYLLNFIPVINTSLINKTDIENRLFNGFTLIFIKDKIIACETRSNLNRGVSSIEYEKTIIGPKDAFIEHYNTNLGLIRRRIKSKNLHIKTYELGNLTKTKVGLIYINNVTKKNIIKEIDKKLSCINIDGIIDSNYLKKYLNTSKSLFPTIKETERPDIACTSLLEGKALILVDNSPEVLILPTLFIDFFHMSDDYYQKRFNVTFIRFIRLIAFLIAIFLPAIYISLTTHNPDNMPINLLLSFQSQRQNVPFPAFIEAILMMTTFEILRETDVRVPSSMGSSISILGGLVLGSAAVDAGIVSPIMIIVTSLSAVSGMLISGIDAINSVRFYRFLLIILSSFLGFYGIFLGIILILTTLSSTKSLDKDYLYPFSPIDFEEQKDAFLKLNTNLKKRNPILSNNKKRGY
ncbi:MAG: spore germination protein [Bacilli bacterium]|nr:spore germination protein [Bacilli bacterium]